MTAKEWGGEKELSKKKKGCMDMDNSVGNTGCKRKYKGVKWQCKEFDIIFLKRRKGNFRLDRN